MSVKVAVKHLLNTWAEAGINKSVGLTISRAYMKLFNITAYRKEFYVFSLWVCVCSKMHVYSTT